MKGMVAIQRRLLVLIYTIFNKNIPYDIDYQANEKIRQNQNLPSKRSKIALPKQHSLSMTCLF